MIGNVISHTNGLVFSGGWSASNYL